MANENNETICNNRNTNADQQQTSTSTPQNSKIMEIPPSTSTGGTTGKNLVL